MMYLTKISPFHKSPKGTRLHGFGGLTIQARGICSWLNLPSRCKQRLKVEQLQIIADRRVVRETGEVLEAMYRRVFQPAGMRLYPNGPLPDLPRVIARHRSNLHTQARRLYHMGFLCQTISRDTLANGNGTRHGKSMPASFSI
jgi:hypothetical protein